MTTATINFDQPTLFREGRFTRDTPSAPVPDRAPSTPRPNTPAAPSDRSHIADERLTTPPSDRASVEPSVPTEPAHAPHSAPAHAHDGRSGVTLDDVLSGAWEGLAGHTSVTCPVCSGSMAPRYGSGPQPVGGRCKRCGSTLG